ncbi:MAG: hypothetical protein U5L04_09550 [Trueperaceae bacterium]|nr:hypothetical protein [Trueperaceae bacterium]
MFQSSAAPKDGCNFERDGNAGVVFGVSILSRPEGRLQRLARRLHYGRLDVSILSRPEGRLQLAGLYNVAIGPALFQSSAAPKDGCNQHNAPRLGRAPVVSILSRPEGRLQRASHARH